MTMREIHFLPMLLRHWFLANIFWEQIPPNDGSRRNATTSCPGTNAPKVCHKPTAFVDASITNDKRLQVLSWNDCPGTHSPDTKVPGTNAFQPLRCSG